MDMKKQNMWSISIKNGSESKFIRSYAYAIPFVDILKDCHKDVIDVTLWDGRVAETPDILNFLLMISTTEPHYFNLVRYAW